MSVTGTGSLNRTLFVGDNLDVLRRLGPDVADLVYTDSPFGSGTDRRAAAGSDAEGAAFVDTWRGRHRRNGLTASEPPTNTSGRRV